jgi:putative hydrolase of the HAD superfamily
VSGPYAGVVLALDVDGVVLDSERAGRGKWHRDVEERWGVDIADLQREFFQPSWPNVVRGKHPIEPALTAALQQIGWPMTTDELLACWFESDFVVDHDVVAAAAAWSDGGARVVLVTDQEHRRAAYLREELGELLPVSTFVYSAAIGRVKRDDGYFAAACSALGIDAAERAVVFVDDTRPNVDAARRHGWSAVHFTRADGWRDEIEAALRQACAPARARGG